MGLNMCMHLVLEVFGVVGVSWLSCICMYEKCFRVRIYFRIFFGIVLDFSFFRPGQ